MKKNFSAIIAAMLLISLRRLAVSLTLCLLALAAVFFVQFKNERLLHINIGKIRVSLNKNGDFKMSFQDIVVFSDEKNPVALRNLGGGVESAALLSAEPVQDGARLLFERGVSLDAKVRSEGKDEKLILSATLPSGFKAVIVPCKASGKKAATVKTDGGIEFQVMGNAAPFPCEFSSGAEFFFAQGKGERRFKFGDSEALECGDEFAAAAEAARKNFLERASMQSEREVAAFIAEKCLEGKQSEVLGQKIKKFSAQAESTFFTSPHFGGLLEKYAKNLAQEELRLQEILNFAATKDERIFKEKGAVKLLQEAKMFDALRDFSQTDAKIDEKTPDIPLLAGILRAYSDFSALNPENAANLESLSQKAAAALEMQLEISGNGLKMKIPAELSEGEKIALANSLLLYGNAKNRGDIQKAANLLLRSFFAESPISPSAFAENYEVFMPECQWFPRKIALRAPAASFDATVFTAAKSIAVSASGASFVEISAEFFQGLTEYMVFKGIPPFKRLEIHNLDYHSDAKFEIYNASGYVYDEKSQTLFFKLKHKAGPVEKIRFVF